MSRNTIVVEIDARHVPLEIYEKVKRWVVNYIDNEQGPFSGAGIHRDDIDSTIKYGFYFSVEDGLHLDHLVKYGIDHISVAEVIHYAHRKLSVLHELEIRTGFYFEQYIVFVEFLDSVADDDYLIRNLPVYWDYE